VLLAGVLLDDVVDRAVDDVVEAVSGVVVRQLVGLARVDLETEAGHRSPIPIRTPQLITPAPCGLRNDLSPQ
jgi:hypothetical protein